MASSASPEGRSPEDDASRLFRPIPRARQRSPTQTGDVSNVPVSSAPPPSQDYPVPPGMDTSSSTRGPQGPQFVVPAGSVPIPPPTDTVEYRPSSVQDNATPSLSSFSSYFDPAFLRNLPLGGNAGAPPAASAQPVGPQAPQQLHWDGILSQQQQNPYGTNVATPGILVPDFFNPYMGYQGAGGPLGFAVEAQAFLGNEGSTNWQDPLNVGYVLIGLSILNAPCAKSSIFQRLG